MTTINGYRIEFKPQTGIRTNGDMGFAFGVRSPEDKARQCTVTLSHLVTELVKAHTDREQMPGGDRFLAGVVRGSAGELRLAERRFPPRMTACALTI